MDRFTERRRQAELMDDPSLDAATHRQALAGLRRVNWWSRTDAAIWSAVAPVAQQVSGRALRILDIGSGGGDQLIRLGKRLRDQQISAHLEGWDISAEAIEFASEQAHRAGMTNLSFQVRDCIRDRDGINVPDGINESTSADVDQEEHAGHEKRTVERFDVVMCSLFLHHLDESDAIRLLSRMKELSDHLVIVDDLRRTALGYWLAWAGCRILTRCRVVHVDGPMSVEGAFTTEEASELARQAGLSNCRIRTHWPQRFLLTWSRS